MALALGGFARAVPTPDNPRLTGLVADLAAALDDERGARAEVRAALRRQADLLRHLQAAGLPATLVVYRLGVVRGVALGPVDRQRIARRLRKRAERETGRRSDLARPHGPLAGAVLPSDRAHAPTDKEPHMPARLIKKTTTVEEYEDELELEDEEHDGEEQDVEDNEEVEDGEEEDKPKASTPARRHRK